MAKLDVKQIIFDLAEYEKQLCCLGEFNEEDEKWLRNELGFDADFTNDDVYYMGLQEISELIFNFIDHCEKVGGE